MLTEVVVPLENHDDALKHRIDREAYALFSGNPAKGGASEIVRMISRRADDSARRELELAWERARTRTGKP
jgi:hypothetical protein